MQVIRYTITGKVPSKKNSRQNINIGGRLISVPSKQYKEWHKDAMAQLIAQGAKPTVAEVCEVSIFLYAPDRRARDLTNGAESIMDLLVDVGVIEEDNWFVVPKVTLVFCGVDRENPRAEIELHAE